VTKSKAGGTPEGRILAGYYGLNGNISFTFQAIKNFSARPTYLRLGFYCKVFGDFVIFGDKNNFSKDK